MPCYVFDRKIPEIYGVLSILIEIIVKKLINPYYNFFLSDYSQYYSV